MKKPRSRSMACALALTALLSGCAPTGAPSTPPPGNASTQTTPATSATTSVSNSTSASQSPVAVTSITPNPGATPGLTASPGADGTPNTNTNVPVVEGVLITVHKAGSGEAIKKGEAGNFHYTGWLEAFDSAKQFDSSRSRGPFKVQLGNQEVIPGWDQGLVGMQPGEVRRLVISPEMGYGASGAGADIPPNATLYFEVEYLGLAN